MTTPATPIHTPGELLGPYELERLLGRGAAAEVWQAVETGDLGFRKRQALKLLRPPPGEMEAQKKALITEARVCGHLKHPGVVDVYRVGEHNGEIFVAMEFVDGPDLNNLLEGLRQQKVQIPIPVCLEMAVEICEALDHAHTARADDGAELEIIHRDLKPSNILVDRRGVLKISDWGLVKSSINLESTTRGVVKGTPGYIAPEVWGGTRDFQPSVDLFAVGAMLYEFVVGERLFQGRNLARIAEQVARRRPEEEAARVGVRAPALVPIMTRLLQRVPASRYQTAEEASAALREVHASVGTRETLKDFLRGVSHIVQRLSPAVTGTGRVGADPELTVDTPVPGPPALAPTGSVVQLVDQNAPTLADDPSPAADDDEQPTDPNLAPIGGKVSPGATESPGGNVQFPAPRTVIFTPGEDVKTEMASAFGPSGPVGTEGESKAVPATRAMPQVA
ncbi:MAG: serine/threonine protein kinase, partial [Deltaproteobacteria bacterium]|nr:serine/threonine protein kinase [Deltaproteobacteria bacterium]